MIVVPARILYRLPSRMSCIISSWRATTPKAMPVNAEIPHSEGWHMSSEVPSKVCEFSRRHPSGVWELIEKPQSTGFWVACIQSSWCRTTGHLESVVRGQWAVFRLPGRSAFTFQLMRSFDHPATLVSQQCRRFFPSPGWESGRKTRCYQIRSINLKAKYSPIFIYILHISEEDIHCQSEVNA